MSIESIEKIVQVAKEEYSKHHLACMFYRPDADSKAQTLEPRECHSECDECWHSLS